MINEPNCTNLNETVSLGKDLKGCQKFRYSFAREKKKRKVATRVGLIAFAAVYWEVMDAQPSSCLLFRFFTFLYV